MASTKLGTVIPSVAIKVTRLSSQEFWWRAASVPSSVPRLKARMTVGMPTWIVTG